MQAALSWRLVIIKFKKTCLLNYCSINLVHALQILMAESSRSRPACISRAKRIHVYDMGSQLWRNRWKKKKNEKESEKVLIDDKSTWKIILKVKLFANLFSTPILIYSSWAKILKRKVIWLIKHQREKFEPEPGFELGPPGSIFFLNGQRRKL